MNRRDLADWLIGHTRSLLTPLIVSILARIVGQLLAVAMLMVIVRALGRAADGQQVSIVALVAWLVGLALLKAALRYLEHWTGHWVAFTALQRLRELFFDRLVPQAPAATTGRAGAELTETATRDIDRIEVFFAHTFPPAVSAIVVPTLAIAWLGFSVDGDLALVLAPFVVVALVLTVASSGSTWSAARRVGAARGRLAAQIGDDVQGVGEVLGFAMGPQRLASLDAAGDELVSARIALGRVQAFRTLAIGVLQWGSLIALAVVGTRAELSPTTIAVGLVVAVSAWAPVRGLDGFTAGLDGVFAATARVRQVVDAAPTVVDQPRGGSVPRDAAVSVESVAARHLGADEPALSDVTAQFPAGQWSVVVGVSGSGKSTLAALLPRGLDPEAGTVRLGGVDVRDLPLDDLRRRVALVSQNPTLVAGTLGDNVRLAAPDADDATVAEALRISALDDWIGMLPAGLDTPAAERGLSVSGGQLQRLALARALAGRPEVLVLDEALSQLDADTAAQVRTRLATARPGLTVIEVTHRADLVADEARVVAVDRGSVAESGTAAALRSADGPFTRLEARG